MSHLDGWAIVQAHGMTLIGKLTERCLSPVFELKPQMAASQSGVQIGHVAMPVWLLGIESFEIPLGAVVEGVESFGRTQRASLHQAVQVAERIQEGIRANEAGIVIAPAGAKVR